MEDLNCFVDPSEKCPPDCPAQKYFRELIRLALANFKKKYPKSTPLDFEVDSIIDYEAFIHEAEIKSMCQRNRLTSN